VNPKQLYIREPNQKPPTKHITTVKNSCWEKLSKYFRILNGSKETQSSSKVQEPELPQSFGVMSSNTSHFI